jgi:hypothetical protein
MQAVFGLFFLLLFIPLSFSIGVSVFFDLKWRTTRYSIPALFWPLVLNALLSFVGCSFFLVVFGALFHFIEYYTSEVFQMFVPFLVAVMGAFLPYVLTYLSCRVLKKQIHSRAERITIGYGGVGVVVCVLILCAMFSFIPWHDLRSIDKHVAFGILFCFVQSIAALILSYPLIFLTAYLKKKPYQLRRKIFMLVVISFLYITSIDFIYFPLAADYFNIGDTLAEIGLFSQYLLFAGSVFLVVFVRNVKWLIA